MDGSASSNQFASPDRVPRTAFAGLFIANGAAMLGMGILLPLLSPFAKRLGASGTIVGIIFAGYALARGIFSPLFGRISDRYGRKNIMLVGLFLYAGLSFGYILLHQIVVLAILWFCQGVASAMVTPIAQSYIGDITPQGKEGRVMNLFYLGQFGGVAIGPAIGGYLTDHVSFNAPFFVMAAAAAIGFALVQFVVPRRSKNNRHKKEENNSQNSFLDVLKDRSMRGILSYMVGRGFYRWGFNSFFPIYAVSIASLSHSQVGLIITSYMITGTLLQYPFGRLADRIAEHRAELVALGGGMAALTTLAVPLIRQMVWLVLLVVVMGIFSAISRASTVAIRTERGRVHGMGAVTGVYTAGFSTGQVMGPLGFGVISDIWNIPISFYIGGLAGLLTTGLAYWYLYHESAGDRKNFNDSGR